jgi:hypothetical protein
MRKIILRQGQSPGDILTMTRAIGDLKRTYPDMLIDVRSPCPELWSNNPHLTPLDENDPNVEVFDVAYDDINISGWDGLHFSDAFRHDIEKKVGVDIKKTGLLPEIYLSDEEKGWVNQVEVEFGWKGAFWIINAGIKPDNELKKYHRWQEFVDLFNEQFGYKIKLVQIGHASHIHPELDGVFNLIGKTDMRQMIRLHYWAHGIISPISFPFVLAAAFEKPHVIVAAGKEGIRWHLYPNGRWLHTIGALECCKFDGCWLGGGKGACKDLIEVKTKGKPETGLLLEQVPRCFEMIKPYQILDAVKSYYEGRALGYERGM